uniref:Uncharacterized protein n=1 Tax=Megaselia scalaris TaxID=36166 RepID=T1GWE4_MEGSC
MKEIHDLLTSKEILQRFFKNLLANFLCLVPQYLEVLDFLQFEWQNVYNTTEDQVYLNDPQGSPSSETFLNTEDVLPKLIFQRCPSKVDDIPSVLIAQPSTAHYMPDPKERQ